MSQRPAAVGLLLCEQAIVEEATRNVTPVNCFTSRTVRQFPSELLAFSVFAILNDGSGDIHLDVTLERLDTLAELHRRSVSARFSDQLENMRCIFRIRDFSFPVAGAYQVLLYADDEVIAQRRFRVTKKDSS